MQNVKAAKCPKLKKKNKKAEDNKGPTGCSQKANASEPVAANTELERSGSILAPCVLVASTVTGGNRHTSALCIVLFTAVNIQDCVSTRSERGVVVSFFL